MSRSRRYSVDDYLIKNVKMFGQTAYVKLDDAMLTLDSESDRAWQDGYDKGYGDALDEQMSLMEMFDD